MHLIGIWIYMCFYICILCLHNICKCIRPGNIIGYKVMNDVFQTGFIDWLLFSVISISVIFLSRTFLQTINQTNVATVKTSGRICFIATCARGHLLPRVKEGDNVCARKLLSWEIPTTTTHYKISKWAISYIHIVSTSRRVGLWPFRVTKLMKLRGTLSNGTTLELARTRLEYFLLVIFLVTWT